MLNKKMNEAMSIISAMTIEEKMMYISLTFEETVMDKDYLMGEDIDEVPCVVTYNSGVQKSKKFNPKHTLRDKSKAGYHNGARKQGFGSYDRFGKPEKMAQIASKDFKAQLEELNELPDNISINEAVSLLNAIYDPFHFDEFSMDLVWCHKSDWYDNLQENISMVETVYQEYVGKLQSIQADLYYFTETLFPEMGMGFQNEVVETFNKVIKNDLFFMKNRMVHWLVCRYKDNREYELMEEQIRHDARVAKLNKMMEEAEKYIK